MTTIAPPSPDMIQARFFGGSQTPKAVVMHGTVSPCKPGDARSVANRWHGPTSPKTSAHYVADPSESVQCVPDHRIAYHCGYNTGSIGYELSDPETGPASRWNDDAHTKMLKIAAQDVARLCLAYDIEIKRPSVAELKAKGPHGIYGHNDSRLAFGSTTHTDPIGFPWDKFIGMVKDAADALEASARKPAEPKVSKRVKRFLAHYRKTHRLNVNILARAGKNGNKRAASARDEIDRLVRSLPKDKHGSRVNTVRDHYLKTGVVLLGKLSAAVKAGRKGKVRKVRNQIVAQVKALGK